MEWLLYWHWFALALLLVIAETLGASGFLVALGMAAATTGLITSFSTIGWQWQLVIFSILCIAFAYAWWSFLKRRTAVTGVSLLNRPLDALVGRSASLVEAIEHGRGKVRINDAHWFVTGPELPVGTQVKIIGVQEGNLLLVEPLVTG